MRCAVVFGVFVWLGCGGVGGKYSLTLLGAFLALVGPLRAIELSPARRPFAIFSLLADVWLLVDLSAISSG